jgi:hypothetical protein
VKLIIPFFLIGEKEFPILFFTRKQYCQCLSASQNLSVEHLYSFVYLNIKLPELINFLNNRVDFIASS